MTVRATARDATPREPAAIALTPPDGATVPLTVPQGRALHHELLNAILRLERSERDGILAEKVKIARKHEREARAAKADRELRRPAKVDKAMREREG